MRRGRPPAVSNAAPAKPVAKPSPSPMRVTNGDPFAALDSKTGPGASSDELSSRFPTLDQFSLLHDQGSKFDFDSPASPTGGDFKQRVADQLADEAFSQPAQSKSQSPQRQSADMSRVKSATSTAELHRPSPSSTPVGKHSSAPPKPEETKMSRASAIIYNNPELQAISSSKLAQPTPHRPSMVSTGTMTAGSPPPEMPSRDYPPIYRFPPADHHRSSSLSRQPETSVPGQTPRSDATQPPRSIISRVPSFPSPAGHSRHSSSSRPSLEGGRPSVDLLDPLGSPPSQSARPRPVSTYLESTTEYLRDREAAPRPLRSPGLTSKFPERIASPGLEPLEDTAIESNVEFLRSMEETDNKKKDKPTKHGKRSSLGSLSGTKNIIASKFGDAFKRFEGGSSPGRTPSPLKDYERRGLTPITGSEAAESRSDDGDLLGDMEELSPEKRRELEAQALAEEERRVEAAAAEYRQRVAARDAGSSAAALPKSIGGVSRAVSIQNRVQNLLNESQKPPAAPKTAEGYGRFTDAATAANRAEKALPEIPRKPVGMNTGRSSAGPGPAAAPPARPGTGSSDMLHKVRSVPSVETMVSRSTPPSSKPSAPPKPTHLNSIPTGGRRSPTKPQRLPANPPPIMNTEQLVGVGVPGRPLLDMSPQEKEDYISDFSKRFPSLNAIEMVERELGSGADRRGVR
jgi:AP2-associated kinase